MRSPRRGQIFRLQSDSVGKKRPVLVVSPTHLNGGIYVLAVPFYSQQIEKRRELKNCVIFSSGQFGLDADCVAITNQVTVTKVSDLRMSEGALGEIDEEKMAEVEASLLYSLGITLRNEPGPQSGVKTE